MIDLDAPQSALFVGLLAVGPKMVTWCAVPT